MVPVIMNTVVTSQHIDLLNMYLKELDTVLKDIENASLSPTKAKVTHNI